MIGTVCRVILLLLSILLFLITLLINGLAATGRGTFHSTTGNVSGRYETDVTPAAWTFSIWGVIYFWLSLMVIYLCSFLLRRGWCLAVLPGGFYISWLINLTLNMTWLVLWDREYMVAALVVLVLVCVSGYSAVFFSCYSCDRYGLWLKMQHPVDLFCIRILVQNGLVLYLTWTSIATLINFALALNLWGVVRSTAATAALCILLADVLVWYFLENFVLDRYVRNILTVYPVVIVALVGIVTRHHDPADPRPNAVFMVLLLVLSCVLLVFRVITVVWRNWRHPLYSRPSRVQIRPASTSDRYKRRIFM